ncbi:MAG: PASTA domain-containing protein [Ignavibacteriales bacterium]|nr:MAG: PASTA domain-containing protein [Ignavibacteriales bacterium]
MINSRALIITGLLLLVFVLLIVKLFTIQISKHEYYTLIADRQQNKPQSVKAERGTIKDANGEVLSYTMDNISFYVDRRMMTPQRVDSVVSIFSRVFANKKEYYKKIIDDGFTNVCLEKKVSMDKAFQIKKNVIEGLFSEEDFTRIYPYGSLASHVLGYVNRDMVGVEGIEKVYENELMGTDGMYTYERDVLGRILSIDENISKAAIPGNNINLTINKTYQKILEEELSTGLQKYNGQSAVGIIMNPNTGEILALANSPDFDPANYELFPADSRRNRAITDTYEPGSTIKAIIMSILFDRGLAKENEIINTENGTFVYKNVKIEDTHKHENLTVRQVLEQSSNVGMAKLSERIDDETLYKYLRDFGFSNATSVDLPSEANGLLKKPGSFSALTKPFVSFGYEIAVTPLQMIAAYSAIVNGGTLLQPFILKSITDQNGKIILENQTKKIRTVIEKSTSDLIKDFMVGVVEHGTGIEAQLPDVLVGGKTGTSQQLVNKSYSSSQHNSSFIGYFPADDPKVICFILINAPQVGQYGGLVAAPIFREVAKRMIETNLSLVPNKKKIERKQNLIDQLVADIKTAPKTKSVSFLNVGDKSLTNISTRKIYNENPTTMPNLINQSMRDAIARLNEIGMQYKVIGTGKVVWQNLEPGSNIIPGTVCLLKCEPLIKKVTASTN